MSEVLCGRCRGTGDGDGDMRPVCWWCDGTGYVQGCAVGGCERPAEQTCEMCGEEVCARHSQETMGMRLCFSCAIGVGEGLGAALKGW